MAGFSIIAKLGMDSSKFRSGASKMGGAARKLGGMIGTVLKAGLIAAAAAIVKFTVDGIKAFANFEHKMAEVNTLLGKGSGPLFEKMKKDIRELATSMGVDLNDAVKSLYNAISSGVDPENAVQFLMTSTRLAKASASTLEESTRALTAVINGYGGDARDAEEISKILFATVKAGSTTMQEFAPVIGTVTAIAASMSIRFEDLAAMVAQVTNKLSGDAPRAMTQIKAMMVEMGREGTKVSEMFEGLSGGVSIRDFLASGNDMSDVLKILGDEGIRTNTSITEFFSNIDAGAAALNMLGDETKNLGIKMADVAGSTEDFDDAVEKMEGTQVDAWGKIKSAWTETLVSIGESLAPLVDKLLPLFKGFLETYPKLFAETEGGANLLALAMEGIVYYFKIGLSTSLLLANELGGLADNINYLVKIARIFIETFRGMGKTAFAPLLSYVELTMTAFRSLAKVMEDPTDIGAAKKAFKDLEQAWGKHTKAAVDFNKGFKDEFKKHQKEMNEAEAQLLRDRQKRAGFRQDILGAKGMFDFMGAAKVVNANMQGAEAAAGGINRNLRSIKGAAQVAARNIDDKLIKALARGGIEAQPLVKAMNAVQAAAKAAADFWAQAVKDIKEVAKGKGGDLQMVGRGGALRKAVVEKIPEAQLKLMGGADLVAGQMAALDPKQMKEVMEAFEFDPKAGRILLASMQQEQRARDQTREGLKALDASITGLTEASRLAGVSLKHLPPAMKDLLKWWEARRDIADENIRLAFLNNLAMGKLVNANAALAESAGELHDERMKDLKDQDKEKIARMEKQFNDLGDAVEDAMALVQEEAIQQGVEADPANLKEFKQAKELMAKVDAVKKTAEESLEDILEVLMEMKTNGLDRNMELGNIALNTIWIHDQVTVLESIDNKMSGLIEAVNQIEVKEGGEAPIRKGGTSELAQEETQKEVLETVSGFFINQ